MAEKKGFVIYFDWREQFELLPPEDRGKLLMALLDYAEEDQKVWASACSRDRWSPLHEGGL